MSRYVGIFWCVWYLVSVFSKTEIMFGQYSAIVENEMPRENMLNSVLSGDSNI